MHMSEVLRFCGVLSIRLHDSWGFQDNVKKMLERADQLQRGKISTHVVKAIFAANSDEQFVAAMKQLEGK